MTTAELIRMLTEVDPNGTQHVVIHHTNADYIFGVAFVEGWPQPARGYPEAVAIVLGDHDELDDSADPA